MNRFLEIYIRRFYHSRVINRLQVDLAKKCA